MAAAAGLTEREHAVLVGLAEGLEVKQIARQLGITVNTCRGYVRSVRSKFGVHTQLAAVVRAAHQGMLPNLHGRPTRGPLATERPAPVTVRVRDLCDALGWRGLVPVSDPELDQLGATLGDLAGMAEELARRNLELVRTNEELTRMHQALDAERARFEALFDLAPVARLATDCDGMVHEANRAAVGLFGRPYPKLVGTPLVRLVVPQDRSAVLRALARSSRPGQSEVVVDLLRRRVRSDPPPRVALLGVAPPAWPGGAPTVQWTARLVTPDGAAGTGDLTRAPRLDQAETTRRHMTRAPQLDQARTRRRGEAGVSRSDEAGAPSGR